MVVSSRLDNEDSSSLNLIAAENHLTSAQMQGLVNTVYLNRVSQ